MGIERSIKQWAAGIGGGLLNWAQGLADLVGAGPLVAEFTNRFAGDAAGTGYMSDTEFQKLISELVMRAQKTAGLDYDRFMSQLNSLPQSSPAIRAAVDSAAARLAKAADSARRRDADTSARLNRAEQLAVKASEASQHAGSAMTNEVGRLQQTALNMAKGVEAPVKEGDWVNNENEK